MVISNNKDAKRHEFEKLLSQVNDTLNEDASRRPDYYQRQTGRALENVVYDVMVDKSIETPFEGTIEIVSGQKFPDIVAYEKYYGLEVKSSVKDHWVTIGNSVLESTRVEDVERVYVLFGKLATPVTFKYRRYEECLCDVVVTHYPRYRIDMDLENGNTIFDRMNISYDELRQSENPVTTIASYYKSQLKPGESLWWADDTDIEKTAVPMEVRMLHTVSSEEKKRIRLKGMVRYPEIFGVSPRKFDRINLWMATELGVISNSTRDLFSAGGKFVAPNGKRLPHIFQHVAYLKEEIISELISLTDEEACSFWNLNQGAWTSDKLGKWISLIVSSCGGDKDLIKNYLTTLTRN